MGDGAVRWVVDTPSEWHVEVVRIGPVEKHPNADTLSITKIHGGYPVIFKTGDYHEGDLAVYVPVDSLVPVVRDEFAWLASPSGRPFHRVRAARLRGIFSMGLLVTIPTGIRYASEGLPMAEFLGVTRYEPPTKDIPLPRGVAKARTEVAWMPSYGVHALRRYPDVLTEGEEVVMAEKIHGTNARYCYRDGKLWVGSHRVLRGTTRGVLAEWVTRVYLKVLRFFGPARRTSMYEVEGDVWWQMAEQADLKERLSAWPDMVVYGEIYGSGVQDLTYGLPQGERAFRVFDVLDIKAGRFLDYMELVEWCARMGFAMPPEIYRGPWLPSLLALAEGQTKLNDARHIREGFVVRPVKERSDTRCGRVIFKVIAETYLLRKEAA